MPDLKIFFGGIALLAALLCLTSCRVPGQRTETVKPEAPLANFRVEATGERGWPVAATLYLIAADGCVEPAWAKAEVDEASRTVVLRAATKDVQVAGVACPASVGYPSISATFTPQNTGTYTVRATLLPEPTAASSTGGYAHFDAPIDLDIYPPVAIEATLAVVVSE